MMERDGRYGQFSIFKTEASKSSVMVEGPPSNQKLLWMVRNMGNLAPQNRTWFKKWQLIHDVLSPVYCKG